MTRVSCCPVARALLVVFGVCACSAAVVLAAGAKKEADKPKYDSKEVMKQAHKGDVSIYKKVEKGTSTAADHAKLIELYKALAANKPPKGDQKSWDEKTGALVKAAEALQKGTPNAKAQLKMAANCKACHAAHKPD